MNKIKEKIAIIGFGLEGKDVLDYLQKNEIKDITIYDKKDKHKIEIPNANYSKVKFITGSKYLNNGLSQYTIIFRSPGVYRYIPEIVKAEINGTKVTSNINLFFEKYTGLTIGVTGTKGKGTTSTLIYEILRSAQNDNDRSRKRKVFLAGNIGSPPLSILDKTDKDSIVILELSSFQLIDLKVSPNISVVLNITSDHLDWHKNQREYIKAKKNIVKYQNTKDVKVINYDYRSSRFFENLSPSKNYFFSKYSNMFSNGDVIARTERTKQSQNRLPRYVPQSGTSFAMTNNTYETRGVYVKDGIIYSNILGKEIKIGKTSDLLLRGRHNWENVCAAICAAQLAGADVETIKKVVFSFKGLEHRLELVGKVDGVKYYNDSFSTNPETTIAAVDSFTEPITLILGGYDKGLDFEKMIKHLCRKKNLLNIILIGNTQNKLNKLLRIYKFNSLIVKLGKIDMTGIVAKCKEVTKKGSVVLLSPACASFDMFTDYKDRGNQFKEEVGKLK